jgi:thioesterase domain-containing protein
LGQEHPFVLVGHSFGGIVIESLVIEIHKISQQQHSNNLEKTDVEKANVFLKNMAGVAFYAISHVGSRQLIEYICRQHEINLHSKKLTKVKAIILENIDSSISKAANLSNDFLTTLPSCSNIYGVYVFIETKPIYDNVGMIVKYGPAQIPGHRCYKVEGCDHFNVCKPPDQNHPSYNMLLQFLEECRKHVGMHQMDKAN